MSGIDFDIYGGRETSNPVGLVLCTRVLAARAVPYAARAVPVFADIFIC